MRDRPIGVFDSGLGGLTVVRELRRALPKEDFIYFGDTGRVPYGSRSNETIARYTWQDIRFLCGFDIKQIVVACGTASSVLAKLAEAPAEAPILRIIEPTARLACRTTRNGRIGVIGTAATISNRPFQRAIAALRPEAQVFSQSCPLFVPLAECGFSKGECARIAAERYLAGLREQQVDTLILGCTHYPLLKEAIAAVMGPEVALVDAGEAVALELREQLEEKGLLSLRERAGRTEYYVSDGIENFGGMGEEILGEPVLGQVKRIDIEAY